MKASYINTLNPRHFLQKLRQILALTVSVTASAKDFYFCSPSWTDVGGAQNGSVFLANSQIMARVDGEKQIVRLQLLGGIAIEEFDTDVAEMEMNKFTVDKERNVLVNGNEKNNYEMTINGKTETIIASDSLHFSMEFSSLYEDGSLQWKQTYTCR